MFTITVLMFAKQHSAYWCLLAACRQLMYGDVTVKVLRLWRGMWAVFGATGKNKYILESTALNYGVKVPISKFFS